MIDVLARPVGRGTIVERTQALGSSLVYLVTASIGGAATGLLLTIGSHVLHRGLDSKAIAVALVAVCLVAALCEARNRVRPFAQRSRQVPRKWMNWRHRSAMAGGFGLLIGSGIAVPLNHATAYCVAAGVVAIDDVRLGLAVGVVYGAARGSTVASAPLRALVTGEPRTFAFVVGHPAGVRYALAGTSLTIPMVMMLT